MCNDINGQMLWYTATLFERFESCGVGVDITESHGLRRHFQDYREEIMHSPDISLNSQVQTSE